MVAVIFCNIEFYFGAIIFHKSTLNANFFIVKVVGYIKKNASIETAKIILE